MSKLSAKHVRIFGLSLSVLFFAMECQSAPIRTGIARAAGMNPRARAASRIQANRSLRQLLASGRSGSVATFSGLKGASGISAASTDIGTVSTAAVTSAATASTPTLYDVWAALAPTMRYASLLEPDPNTGLLPDTAFVADLYSRRTVNQVRFDTYHPQIAQLLDWETVIQDASAGPRPANTPSNTNPQVIIPEPSSVLIGLGLIGFAAWHRARTRVRI